MNLETGVSHWEILALGDYSNYQASSSQKIVSHKPTPNHSEQNLELTTSPENSGRHSHTLKDVPRIVAAEQARARDDRPTEGKKKSSFFDKWRRKSGGFI